MLSWSSIFIIRVSVDNYLKISLINIVSLTAFAPLLSYNNSISLIFSIRHVLLSTHDLPKSMKVLEICSLKTSPISFAILLGFLSFYWCLICSVYLFMFMCGSVIFLRHALVDALHHGTFVVLVVLDTFHSFSMLFFIIPDRILNSIFCGGGCDLAHDVFLWSSMALPYGVVWSMR